jgi:hypothetical protein
MSKYFTEAELACKGSGLLRFHPGFLNELDILREHFGLPMTLNSACRSKAHNAAVGGNPRSLHIGDVPQHKGQEGTLAVDVATPDGHYRGRLFQLAWEMGFSIGWNAKAKFLHLDQRVWIGLSQNSFDY